MHIHDGRSADARRLDDVDGVDKDVWSELDCRRRHLFVNVGCDDRGDGAAVAGANSAEYRRSLQELEIRLGRLIALALLATLWIQQLCCPKILEEPEAWGADIRIFSEGSSSNS